MERRRPAKADEDVSPTQINQVRSTKILTGEMTGNEDATLPFEKKESLIWSLLESKDVFKRLPQKPHFRALEEFCDTFRERRAVGCMLDFCKVVERSSGLEFLNEPMSRMEQNEFLKRLYKLEQNGFNVEFVRGQMAMRENMDNLREHYEEVKGKIRKSVNEKVKIEEMRSFVSNERFEEMMKARDDQVVSLEMKRTVLEEEIAQVERSFQTSVASLGSTDKYETGGKGEFSAAKDKDPAVDIVESELKTRASSQGEKGKGVVHTEEESNKTQRALVDIKSAREEIKSGSDNVSKTANMFFDDQSNEKAKEPSEEYDDVSNVDKDTNDDISESESSQDGLWDEMNMHIAAENCKDRLIDSTSADQGAKVCDHDFVMRDDLGIVCRVCGIVKTGIEKIIEYSFGKKKESERSTYRYDRCCSGNGISNSGEVPIHDGTRLGESLMEVPVHPRHRKFMKPHQFEGLSFLMGNLMTENPGGCVMAHAPGSGKTFMVISFLQVFMTKYPSARPLIILPRGILPTWKREFQKWQVEDLALYDFYSSKAESRSQQLEILRKWGKERSILFLSYKQFTVIVGDGDHYDNETNEECRQILVVSPSILILDEGHNTRNDETKTLVSIANVRTPRKVVLSGTLYQNNVKEVFNILNLVRPNFLKTDFACSIQRRIMSKVKLSSRKESPSDDQFYESVERTILDKRDLKRKVQTIQHLREMTSKILHYYKGDTLDELPGLVDFTVFLKLSEGQKQDIEVLRKCKNSFKIHSDGSAIYLHPRLNSVVKHYGPDEEQIDPLLQNLSEMGAKARFFLNLVHLCQATGEKLLVFSQYLGPLKFLERLATKVKGYILGKEMFMITGDSTPEARDSSMEQFNSSSISRVLFGSIKACGEGISLVGASRIIILDVHLNPSVTRQAIGRAFRPGQKRKVYTYRLVASGSPEEADHSVCFRKECVAKMWFEWNGYRGLNDQFEMETVDVNNCGDLFLETGLLEADVVSVSKRVGSKDANFVQKLGDNNVEQLQSLTEEPQKLDFLGNTTEEQVQKKNTKVVGHEHASNIPMKWKNKVVDVDPDPEYFPSKSHKRTKKMAAKDEYEMETSNCGDLFCERMGSKEVAMDGSVVQQLGDNNVEQIGQLQSLTKEPQKLDSSGTAKVNASERHSNTPMKRKKRAVDVDSDPEYFPPNSHKRTKTSSAKGAAKRRFLNEEVREYFSRFKKLND